MKNKSLMGFVMVFIFLVSISISLSVYAQNIQNWINYSKHSNFIKEFQVSFNDTGLKGITADSQGNAWFYHSTNRTSTIVKFEPDSDKFTQFTINAETVVENPIVSLAGGMLVFDKDRNTIWFTDARTNSIGKLDVQTSHIDLIRIPTVESGPMGIVLSPDSKSVWFTELEGNKIARLDVQSEKITEYFTGDQTGPTFLAFDSNGNLWVTLAYSHNLLRVDATTLNSTPLASPMTFSNNYVFSPFGIDIVNANGMNKIFVSDHGSSRVISSDVNSNLNSSTSYWTSPTSTPDYTLPGQIVSDNAGIIYFPEHGRNNIARINTGSGVMTEYKIPTGPLSIAIFDAISDDGKRLWFTEIAANRIAYLDTTISIPFSVGVGNGQITLDKNSPQTIDISVTATNGSSLVALDKVSMNVTGMTDSGLGGVSYSIQPQIIDMSKTHVYESKITLNAENNARPGLYTIMVSASAFEKDSLVVSQLYPVQLTLSVPEPVAETVKITKTTQESAYLSDLSFPNIIRFVLISIVVILLAYLVYRRIKSKSG